MDIAAIQKIVTLNNGMPVYKQIAEQLKKAILTGSLKAGERLPPEPELASSLGVNRMTLRKSFRLLIQNALLSQVPHRGTFVMDGKASRRYSIGILSASNFTENPYYSNQIALGASVAAASVSTSNLSIVFLSLPKNYEKAPSEIFAKLREIDALIIPIVSQNKIDVFLSPEAKHIPKAFISVSRPELCQDNNFCISLKPDSIELAIKHLYDLGHRRIAYTGPTCLKKNDALFAVDRREGFKNAVRKFGLDDDPRLINLWRGNFYERPHAFCGKILSGRNPPTAIVSGTIATGLILGLMDLGLKTPDDLSITGFDSPDDGIITNIKQPVFDMAFKSVMMLERILATGGMPKEHDYRVEAKLCIRRSTSEPGKPYAKRIRSNVRSQQKCLS